MCGKNCGTARSVCHHFVGCVHHDVIPIHWWQQKKTLLLKCCSQHIGQAMIVDQLIKRKGALDPCVKLSNVRVMSAGASLTSAAKEMIGSAGGNTGAII